MNMRNLFRGADDHTKTLQERIFAIIPIIGLLALFLLIFIGMMVGDDIRNTVNLAVCFLIFIIVFRMSIKKRKVQLGATIIGAILVLFMLPFAFVFGGGINGGSPVWFIFGFAYIGMTVEGRRKYVLLAMGAVTTTIAYYIAYKYPEMVAVHTKEAAYADSMTSVILVSGLLTVMILFQNRIYKAENKLIESQKSEIEELNNVKSRFFSNISHEIRTPIDSIVGFNELILRESDNYEITENAQNIKSASRMLLTLINDFLDLSKLESGNMEIVPTEYDLLAMLSEIVNIVWDSATEKGLAFYVDIDPNLPSKLIGDDMRIEQILMNLMSNAVKFTSEGSIKLTVKGMGARENQMAVQFAVEDTGMGIKRDNMPYLFDEFRRVNLEQTKGIQGTGLGLSIVKHLTTQMEGEVQVNSIYTKGSVFTVTLPQGIASAEPIGEVKLESLRKREAGQFYRQSFEAPGARIMVVDDNMLNRVVVEKLLRDTKMDIDLADGGSKCLELCASNQYDCIFMDLEMPEMDGVECLRQLRSQIGSANRETPVIVVTARAEADDQAKYRMAGFDGYLLKPVSGEMLENTLLRVLPSDKVHRTSPTYIDPEKNGSGNDYDRLQILITTESACDLPKDMLDNLRIPILPLYIKTKSGAFLDGVEAETEGVLNYLHEGNGEGLSAGIPTAQEYEDFFASHLADAENIIHISMSGKAGGAYHVASEAAASFNKITVIDSESISSGIGLLVLEAVRLVEAGKNVQECVREIEMIKKRIHTSFLIDDTQYLTRLGRIKRRTAGFSRIFMLKPAIIFREGRGMLDRMYMGSSVKVRKKYIRDQLEFNSPIDKKRLFITHSNLSQSELDDVQRWVTGIMSFDEIIVQKESASMAAIHGEGAFGLLFMMEANEFV